MTASMLRLGVVLCAAALLLSHLLAVPRPWSTPALAVLAAVVVAELLRPVLWCAAPRAGREPVVLTVVGGNPCVEVRSAPRAVLLHAVRRMLAWSLLVAPSTALVVAVGPELARAALHDPGLYTVLAVAGVVLFWLIPITCAGVNLTELYQARHRYITVRLNPRGLVVCRGGTEFSVLWDGVEEFRELWRGLLPGHAVVRVHAYRPMRAHRITDDHWSRPTEHHPPFIDIALDTLAVPPAVLAAALEHYRSHSEARAELATEAALARLEARPCC
ncbi:MULTISPECIES: hypothetical protein [unclassified Crossiella]|uniref:hypothetical protein n=1 Tax=unclassified Crossiella TaxID=2620835 RepID=UPI001FFF6276|nr:MULTISPECIES: hypothetical protein [unclassified Crossiella]MCK2245253.1 hypothetical protein [Crossiella sp. S99.2]MCK2258906.1 hypothetical protein [Crossiella sp. S99.1]